MLRSFSASIGSGEEGAATICVSPGMQQLLTTKSSLSIGCASCACCLSTTPLVGARMLAFHCHRDPDVEIVPSNAVLGEAWV